ncbi:MAG: AAA family ATPase, partial [Bacteroidia bacterium]
MDITIPEFALILLIGPSGSGKSTFAAKHFAPNEVLSERHFQEMAGYDGTKPAIAEASRSLMAQMAQLRLQQRRSVVVDADLLSQDSRREWWRLAKKHHVRAVAILFDIPTQTCLNRNESRTETCPSPAQVRAQALLMEK